MRRAITIAITLVAVMPLAIPASGQSFLKKLEDKLKGAIAPAAEPAAAEPSDGELPPPAPAETEPEEAAPGYLGLGGEDTKDKSGVQITTVKKSGPGEKAGLRVGDKIVAVDGAAVSDVEEMGILLTGKPAGAVATFTVVRGGKEQKLKVTLEERPVVAAEQVADEPATIPSPDLGGDVVVPKLGGGTQRASLGVTVIPITEEARLRFGITVRRGALISAVRPGSPAERAGLPIGGVVVAMDGHMINTADELVELIRVARPGSEVELTYYQGDKLARKTIKLAAAVDAGSLPPGAPQPGIGIPGDRPILRKVEELLGGLTRPGGGLPGAVPPAAEEPGVEAPRPGFDPDEMALLKQELSNMQAEMRLLKARVEDLESKVKTLEDAGDKKPAEASLDLPPKLNAPVKP